MKVCIWIFSPMLIMSQTLSPEKEQALARGLEAEVRKQVQPFDRPEVSGYVERVGQRLAAVAAEHSFRFEVVIADRTEPAGLAGGAILVPAAFFLAAEDEAEFAGMLAHAMGHAALGHGLASFRSAQPASIPLIFMGGWLGAHADSRQSHALVPMGFLEKAKSLELEADRFGVDLAARAGYDPDGLARYVRRVQPDQSPQFSAVPVKAERLAALADTTGRAGEVDRSEFAQVREIVRAALQTRRKPPSLRN